MHALARLLTPERRQLIQAFLVALAPLAIMFGYGTEGTWQQLLIIAGAVIGAVASLLNLVNVRIGDWATQGWAIVRGVIYSLGTVVSPALVILGFYGDDVNTQILNGLSLGLTVLSSAIAIFASGQQQTIVRMVQATDGTWRAQRAVEGA
jgi:hypothetical protein